MARGKRRIDDIWSTTRGGNYGHASGTSMAAPHVASVAALAWSHAPTAGYSAIRGAILNGADAKTTQQATLLCRC
ncbi:MAG TPA: S8 family serine peptidase [Tepidisphaeraceae bacterium]|nr:S8 family serine peptidase [Tepidisphaeraceae bacterium]